MFKVVRNILHQRANVYLQEWFGEICQIHKKGGLFLSQTFCPQITHPHTPKN